MKAIRVHAYRKPAQLDEVPEPQVTGPDDVIIRIGGAGLCRTDLHIIDGWFADAIPAPLPVVLGHENAGWVHAVGAAVDDLTVGDPVICHPNLTCGELAALADAGLTAYHAVGKAVPALGPGSWAVGVGVGGLGHIGIQCLKAMTAAQVIAVDTSDEALELALACGADHAIVSDGSQALRVRRLTGAGADAVFDFVGEDATITDSVGMLRPAGTYYLVGLIRLAEQGKVRLEFARYPLDAANDAISDLRAGKIHGRAILTPVE